MDKSHATAAMSAETKALLGRTPPVIEPGHSFESVTESIGHVVLSKRTPIGWFLGFFIAFILLMILNMAATLFRLTVDEAIACVTREAARALGRLRTSGTLETGKHCDLAIWEIERPAELVYRIGFNPLHARVWRGM